MKHYDRKINYYETDQMGIVHHSNYARFFEEARISYMDQMGYPYERMEEEGIISPVLAISCKFLHSVRFGDTVRIEVSTAAVSKVKCSFAYKVIDLASGEIKARGESEHGFITKDGKPVILPKEKPEFYQMLMDELGAGESEVK
jgi:acyl-CoA thioester hydrolase